MCNEYSALALAHHMTSPRVSGEPIVRYWNPDIGHSFTAVGDSRVRGMQPYVADGWTTREDPVYLHDSIMAGGQNNVVSTWADRMRGEGREVVRDYATDAHERLDEADAHPYYRARTQAMMSRGRQNQRAALQHLDAGHHVDGIYEHPTNRR
jgi:hypothetical protein